jgi:hypothetical protein
VLAAVHMWCDKLLWAHTAMANMWGFKHSTQQVRNPNPTLQDAHTEQQHGKFLQGSTLWCRPWCLKFQAALNAQCSCTVWNCPGCRHLQIGP